MHAAGQSGHVITWWSKFSSALLAASSSLVRSATFSSRWLAYDSSTSIIESITPEVMTSWLFHNGFVCIYDDARSEVTRILLWMSSNHVHLHLHETTYLFVIAWKPSLTFLVDWMTVVVWRQRARYLLICCVTIVAQLTPNLASNHLT